MYGMASILFDHRAIAHSSSGAIKKNTPVIAGMLKESRQFDGLGSLVEEIRNLDVIGRCLGVMRWAGCR